MNLVLTCLRNIDNNNNNNNNNNNDNNEYMRQKF